MRPLFRITASLMEEMRADLSRPHAFAFERVGFLLCRCGATTADNFVLLAAEYHIVEDADYLDDKRVGAMMGPGAIRKALQRAYNNGQQNVSLFHVHEHAHSGLPAFSRTDLHEMNRFVPDFFNVSPSMPHGGIVFSHDSAVGLSWPNRDSAAYPIGRFTVVGAPLNSWSADRE